MASFFGNNNFNNSGSSSTTASSPYLPSLPVAYAGSLNGPAHPRQAHLMRHPSSLATGGGAAAGLGLGAGAAAGGAISDFATASALPNPGPVPLGATLRVGNTLCSVERYLAEGGCAHVYLVTWTPHAGSPSQRPRYAALKWIAIADEAHWHRTEQEIRVMSRLRQHPYVVQLIDASLPPFSSQHQQQQERTCLILMEYCERGHLVDFLNERIASRYVPEETIWLILWQLCVAVSALHTAGILHRDIKIENILLNEMGTFKLADFGSCTTALITPGARLDRPVAVKLEEEIQKQTTVQYRPPEMCDVYRKRGIQLSADVWAIGVLAYKLVFFTTPFEEGGPLAILAGQYQFPHARLPRVNQFIDACLRTEPDQRPSIQQLLRLLLDVHPAGQADPLLPSLQLDRVAPYLFHPKPAAAPLASGTPALQTGSAAQPYRMSSGSEPTSISTEMSASPVLVPVRRPLFAETPVQSGLRRGRPMKAAEPHTAVQQPCLDTMVAPPGSAGLPKKNDVFSQLDAFDVAALPSPVPRVGGVERVSASASPRVSQTGASDLESMLSAPYAISHPISHTPSEKTALPALDAVPLLTQPMPPPTAFALPPQFPPPPQISPIFSPFKFSDAQP